MPNYYLPTQIWIASYTLDIVQIKIRFRNKFNHRLIGQWAASGLPVGCQWAASGQYFFKNTCVKFEVAFWLFSKYWKVWLAFDGWKLSGLFFQLPPTIKCIPCMTDCDANILSIHKKKRKEKKIGQIKKSQNTLPLYWGNALWLWSKLESLQRSSKVITPQLLAIEMGPSVIRHPSILVIE